MQSLRHGMAELILAEKNNWVKIWILDTVYALKGMLHAPVDISMGNDPRVPITQTVYLAPQPIWLWCWTE
jgi:hypothetical protein